jgi:pyruvate formate lyase activating enzyme
MEEEYPAMKHYSKREFLKMCCLGAGGCLLGSADVRDAEALNTSSPRFVSAGLEPGKWSKEALFFVPVDGGIKCLKCPHGCVLPPDAAGICRNRINYQGKGYTIAYGNPCAVHIDPIEKKPLFHFLPSTRAFSIAAAGCNLRCLNCQNWQISQASPRETGNSDLMPAGVVEEAGRTGCVSIAYTYSEPITFYEYAYDTATLARRAGVRNVWKSNGYINEKPLRQLCKVLDAANIDLKGFDEKIYQELNSASLEPVLRTLKIFHEEGVWLEITNLVIPTWTDDLDTIRRMTEWLCANGLRDCPLHFSRFTPLYKLNQLPATPVATLDKARAIALKTGMRHVYIGNVPGHDAENTYCPRCGRTVVERRGYSIVSKSIVDGKCAGCGEAIAGVWK